VSVLIRSWNVFHGRTFPAGRHAYLREAIALVCQDDPDVVCLQELPLWSLRHLETWSARGAFSARTRYRLGRLGRRPTDVHHAILRSALTGQANAILVAKRLSVLEHRRRVLNGGLSNWPQERRVSHGVRVHTPDGRTMTVVNLHLSHVGAGAPSTGGQLQTTLALAGDLARGDDAIVLAGDFNLAAAAAAFHELEVLGYSRPGPGIDHILVKGAPATALSVWPEERRRVDGRLLSDHAPVELTVG
jgi:endonuclease/exonuclease/phosphatase family metal-dependent hydrolase